MKLHRTERVPLLKGVWLFVLGNIPVSLLIAWPQFQKAMADTGAGISVSLVMFLSAFLSLNLIVLGLLGVLAVCRPPTLAVVGLAALLGSALQIGIMADVRVFGIFRFHINGLILNFLTTEGAGDSLKLGTATLVSCAVVATILLCVETWLAQRLFTRPDSCPWLRRHWLAISVGLVTILITDKVLYVTADLRNQISILSVARYYPLYQKVTAKRFATKWFHYKFEHQEDLARIRHGGTLRYPLQPLTFATNAPHYNVVLLVADGFRADMLSPVVTPQLWNFAQQNIRFENHFSGGNGTRFGIFSLFYGLYGNLWHPFLEARQPPVFIEALRELHYDFCILSSTKLTFPEFRDTVFVTIPESIQDEHTVPESYKRDAVMVDQFHQFLEHHRPEHPFLAFAFFNSSHVLYQYPPAFKKFTPVIPDALNYMHNITPDTADRLRNDYRNSLYYTDSLFAKIINDLKQHGLLDQTILIITGDHGEEFMENHFFSHNSSFDDYQTKTTMVMKFPGIAPQSVTRLTSHLDVVPTILDALGCLTPPIAYSHGRLLFTGDARQYSFCSDWESGAIITTTERVLIPIDSKHAGFIELRSASDYKLIADRSRLKPYHTELHEVAQDLQKFLK